MSSALRPRASRFSTVITLFVGLSLGFGCVADEAPPASSMAGEGVEVQILRPLVLTDAGRIPETESGFVSAEVMADRVALTVEPSFAAPVAGEVIYGSGEPGYLRRVVSTDNPSEGLFIVHTAPAELTDLLADGHFRVTYSPILPGEADPEVAGVAGATGALTDGGEIEVGCGEGNAGLRMLRFGRPEVSLEVEIGPLVGVLAKRVQWDYDDRFYVRFAYEGIADAECEGEVEFEEVELPDLDVFVSFLPITITQEVAAEASYAFSASGGMEEFSRGVSARPTFEAHYDTDADDPTVEAELRPNGYLTGTAAADVTGESSLEMVTTLGFEAKSSLVLGDVLNASVDLTLMSEQSAGDCNWSESNRARDTWTILPGPALMVGEWQTHEDAGLFVGCTDCDSEVRCADDLGRDICLGGEGVQECVPSTGGAGFRACRCGPDGFVSCGACEAATEGGGTGGGGGGGGGGGVSCGAHEDTGYRSGTSFPITVVTIDGKPVERSTANAFLAMRDAAAREGVHIRIVSGFRSMAEQEHLYQCYTTCSCNDCNLAARPGYSNHQSGTALDLNRHDPGVLNWLRAHANAHGFYETVSGEPWHWDYQGSGAPPGPC
jgi:D-alanyl-D-alanine carboxypeptidase